MDTLIHCIQVVIALGILNVWLLRFGKRSAWRGGDARNMKEEFKAYGLPPWFLFAVGSAKVVLALLLLAGVWIPACAKPAATGLAVFMAGAVAMHLKVKDPIKKSMPALAVLLLCLIVVLL